jgi:hypothetical protein
MADRNEKSREKNKNKRELRGGLGRAEEGMRRGEKKS